jgi:hypothetical protein
MKPIMKLMAPQELSNEWSCQLGFDHFEISGAIFVSHPW